MQARSTNFRAQCSHICIHGSREVEAKAHHRKCKDSWASVDRFGFGDLRFRAWDVGLRCGALGFAWTPTVGKIIAKIAQAQRTIILHAFGVKVGVRLSGLQAFGNPPLYSY